MAPVCQNYSTIWEHLPVGGICYLQPLVQGHLREHTGFQLAISPSIIWNITVR
jgi:hypothetical protein